MAHDEPPHQDLRCLQILLFSSLIVKELNKVSVTYISTLNGSFLYLRCRKQDIPVKQFTFNMNDNGGRVFRHW